MKGWKFPIEADHATGKIRLIDGDDSIRQSISLIIGTERGERVMQPYFGVRANQFMFQNIDVGLLANMTMEVEGALELWEDRPTDMRVEVSESTDDETTVVVNVLYQPPGQSQRNQMTTQLNLLTGER